MGTVTVFIYSPENRSGLRVVTGKWILKNEKLTTRLKHKTVTGLLIKKP
jgi:hypothetical protein